MANSTIEAQNDAIFVILDALKGAGQPLNFAYDWPNPKVEGYPAGYIIYDGSRENNQSTQNNLQINDFIVRIIMTDDNDRTSYYNFLSVVDLVLASYRKDDNCTLGGIVENFLVSPEILPYRTSDGEHPLIICDLNVSTWTLQDITT